MKTTSSQERGQPCPRVDLLVFAQLRLSALSSLDISVAEFGAESHQCCSLGWSEAASGGSGNRTANRLSSTRATHPLLEPLDENNTCGDRWFIHFASFRAQKDFVVLVT